MGLKLVRVVLLRLSRDDLRLPVCLDSSADLKLRALEWCHTSNLESHLANTLELVIKQWDNKRLSFLNANESAGQEDRSANDFRAECGI